MSSTRNRKANKTKKTQTPHTKTTTKNKNHRKANEKTSSCRQECSMQIQSSLSAEEVGPCIKQTTTKTKNITVARARGRCKSKTSRCGNPGSPEPGSRRSQRDTHRAQQAPSSQAIKKKKNVTTAETRYLIRPFRER